MNGNSAKATGINATAAGPSQQKRLQGRRQNRAQGPVEESKGGRKVASATNRNEDLQLAKAAARQNLALVQEVSDSRQDMLVAHSEQTTMQGRQRKEKQAGLAAGNSMTTLTGYRSSQD